MPTRRLAAALTAASLAVLAGCDDAPSSTRMEDGGAPPASGPAAATAPAPVAPRRVALDTLPFTALLPGGWAVARPPGAPPGSSGLTGPAVAGAPGGVEARLAAGRPGVELDEPARAAARARARAGAEVTERAVGPARVVEVRAQLAEPLELPRPDPATGALVRTPVKLWEWHVYLYAPARGATTAAGGEVELKYDAYEVTFLAIPDFVYDAQQTELRAILDSIQYDPGALAAGDAATQPANTLPTP